MQPPLWGKSGFVPVGRRQLDKQSASADRLVLSLTKLDLCAGPPLCPLELHNASLELCGASLADLLAVAEI